MNDLFAWLNGAGTFLDKELFNLGESRVTPMSLLVFLFTVVVASAIARLLRNAIRRYVAQRQALSEGMGYALGRMAQMVIMAIGVIIGLENLGISLSTLAAVGAVVGVGIGLGLQGIAQNVVSGIAALIDRAVEKGDFVIVGDTVGVVDEISLRGTRIVTRDQVSIIVPNSELITGRVVNLSKPSTVYRVRIPVGVAYGSDTALVKRTLLEVAAKHDKVLEEPASQVFFQDFGSSSLDFELGVWIDDAAGEPGITSDLRFAIDAAFRKEEITIPFPQRDLHLKTGFEREVAA
jgi:small-conductance mechanosensitive channel